MLLWRWSARQLTSYISSASHAQSVLRLQGQLDIEDACRGFLDLAKAACAGVCGSIFSDPAFAELFHRMYCRRAALAACACFMLSIMFDMMLRHRAIQEGQQGGKIHLLKCVSYVHTARSGSAAT